MRGAADRAVGDLIGRVARLAGDVKRGAQNLFGLLPIHKGVEIEPLAAAFERNLLNDAALVKGADDAHRTAHAVGFNCLDAFSRVEPPRFLDIVGL